jgi:purine-binding chemotaxis protein CheW
MSESQYVVFRLEKEKYGVDIANVGGITEVTEITKVPNSPYFIEGVINLRGSIIPIINLKKRFNIVHTEETNDKRIIIINVKGKDVGYIVDEASQVLRIDNNDIDPTPSLLLSEDRKYISGIAKVNNSIIILLDLVNILNTQEIDQIKNI